LKHAVECDQPGCVFAVALGQFVPDNDHRNAPGQPDHDQAGKAWHEWFPAIRDYLIRIQQPDGSWTEGVGPEFATAMALIILQVPNRYLPILER
jgi:hypothetical protein